ncbi:hypothetical protein GH714_005132 [Hevea brasiliensis]|uniref:TF-B3 domain-containing protein n=1 Tax=Hevea brasiliensis TaxID=3981 RepID=A0A6A6L0V0_HEVBR|nr:hypothetical protein GH714_005132 [Hevea brasiliensis]
MVLGYASSFVVEGCQNESYLEGARFHVLDISPVAVEDRLALPTHFFKRLLLPRFVGTSHFVDLKVKYKNQKLDFRCTKRKKGEYDKPVLTKGWLDFVRRERLKVGDKISLLQGGS